MIVIVVFSTSSLVFTQDYINSMRHVNNFILVQGLYGKHTRGSLMCFYEINSQLWICNRSGFVFFKWNMLCYAQNNLYGHILVVQHFVFKCVKGAADMTI